MSTESLDCKGKRCPMPIVEIFKKINTMEVGDFLSVEADDLAFSTDVHAWCEQTGQKIVELSCNEGVTKALIEKVH